MAFCQASLINGVDVMGIFKKFTNDNSDAEKDKWKDKYLDLIDAQEKVEKNHKSNQELLCKTINRLSISASKIDPQLDPYLQRIRDHIKQNVDYVKLKVELENFTNAVSRLDEGTPITQAANNDVDQLFAFLLQRHISEPQQKALKNLQKNYRSGDDNQHLFAEIDRITGTAQANLAMESVEQQVSLNHPAIDPDFIGKQLVRMLEQIEIPEAYANKAQAFKGQLISGVQATSQGVQLDDVINLLIDIYSSSQSKQKEIDTFLNHVTQQLIELGLTVTDSSNVLRDVSMERNRLDQSVSEQMSDLQQRTSIATELEPLKQVISAHLINITKELQEHKQMEAAKRGIYQQQLEELSQKIKSLESETGELQSKLIIANTNAQRDVLTDLPNRLAYEERLKMEICRWQRYHTPLCLVVWDIDFFKRVNDSYGHQAGDKVLAHISGLFLNNIRKSDFIARFGGEEFIMLLPHTSRQAAIIVTDKLRNLVEQNPLALNNKQVVITLSCGITQFLIEDTHETAFERADQALYKAKEQGRNRCCIG
jgi:diguanylate cyclase